MKQISFAAILVAVIMILSHLPVLAGSDRSAEETINILLDNKNFVPIEVHKSPDAVSPVWRGCKPTDVMNRLKKTKPDFITGEPQYKGKQQLYGYLTLGTRRDNRFYFAMDIISPQNMEMYFDAGRTGRLDQTAPLKNVGRFKDGGNGFAAMLEIPWDKLVDNSPYQGKFKIWFFINSFQWSMAGFSHASRTQLRGTLELGGVRYTTVIADRAENDNDADLTNDGLYLKAEGKEAKKGGNKREQPRYISARECKEGVLINGRRYRFNISYAKGK